MSIEEQVSVSRITRSTLFRVNNLEQLAMENSRSKPTSRLSKPESQCSRDFAGCIRSFQKDSYPYYTTTSHSPPPHLLGQTPVIPTFPIQFIRWHPNVQTPSIEDIPLTPNEEPKYNCGCENCLRDTCPSKVSCTSTVKPRKTSIVKFSDKYTNTSKLTDVGCGYDSVPSTRTSEVFVTASLIAVRDTCASTHIDHFQNRNKPTPSILKRNITSDGNSYCYESPCNNNNVPSGSIHQEAEKDFHYEDQKPTKDSSIKVFFKNYRQKVAPEEARRSIYNEGISDFVANRHPVVPVAGPYYIEESRRDSRQNNIKSCITDKRAVLQFDEDDSPIPHSHRSDSRYHQSCKISPGPGQMYYLGNEELRHTVQTLAPRKPICDYRVPPIRLPKRVLASVSGIDAYIDTSYSQVPGPGKWKKCDK